MYLGSKDLQRTTVLSRSKFHQSAISLALVEFEVILHYGGLAKKIGKYKAIKMITTTETCE